jgi:multidrug efflux pump subunit AcrA (membrane-fusion protein)
MRIAMTLQNPGEVAAAQVAQARGAADGARAQAQAAREQAQAAREQAQATREQAQAQREQAQGSAQSAGQEAGDPVTITIHTADGKTISLQNPTADALAQLGFPVKVEQQGSPDPGPYIIGGISILSTAVVLLVALTQRYRIKMRGAAPSALPADLTQRLSRMEAGIESVAVEVERISEGQRFTTRLLSDRERVEVPRG